MIAEALESDFFRPVGGKVEIPKSAGHIPCITKH